MQLIWFVCMFFIVWIASYIGYWNFKKSVTIPAWILYGSLGIINVLVIYISNDPGYAMLVVAFALGVVQGNKENSDDPVL